MAGAFARAAALCGLALATPASASATATAPQITVGVPEGFAAMVEQQRAVVDLWLGGRRIGEAVAEFGPEGFRFADPAAVAAKIDDLADRAPVVAALSARALAENRERICRGEGTQAGCGMLRPEVAGIIFDAARYRVDIFVNPRFLTVRAAQASDYLAPPPSGLSLLNAIGVTLAGTAGSRPQYALTDAAVLGIGSARLRAALSHSSHEGLRSDILTAEIDRRGMRLAAGFFWSPGDELLGRRRLLGAGIASQFDTRTDRDQIEGTPLVVFLDRRSRVDVLINGRLAATGLYEAGNQALDTSGLPEGSYEVELRISGNGAMMRSERRLFSRTRRLPPLKLDSWQLVGGVLVDDGGGGAGGPLGRISRTPFAQGMWAHRLSAGLAVHAGFIGTDQRQFAKVGATLLTQDLQVETTALASPRGDFGLFARASSRGGGRLAFDIEGRLVESRDQRPLLPEVQARSVRIDQASSFAPAGSFGQVTGSVSYQLGGGGRIAAAATWRRGGDYAAGPSFRLPVLRGKAFDIVAQGDYAFTNRGRAGYIGLSLVLNRGRSHFTAEGGLRESRAGAGRVVPVGAMRVTTQREGEDGQQVQVSAALGRDDGSAYAAGEVMAASRLGEASASVMRPLGGSGAAQYALSLRTSVAAASTGVKLGLNNGEAGIVAAVRGAAPDDRFDVLVGDVPMGRIVGAGKVTVALPAYRTYDVRLRAAGTGMVTYDTAVRRVTLYPGTVAGMRWATARTLAVSGRLLGPDGRPLAHADLSSGPNIAETDGEGAFLIELDADRVITARLADGTACRVDAAQEQGRNSFAALGTRTCVPDAAHRPTPLASPGRSH